MIRHVFLWNVTPEAGADGAQRILDALDRIKDAPVAARSWSVGRDLPAPGSEDSGGRWQFGLVCDYDDLDHLQAYYATPEHAAAVEEILPLIADRAVCDFVL